MVLPTHAAAGAAEDPQERRRRSPLLAGLAALCIGAAVYAYATGSSDEQTTSSRRLEVQEGEDTYTPEYDLPPADLGAVVEAEVKIPGPNSAEPPIDDQVSLIAQQ